MLFRSGSSWTEDTDLNTTRQALGGAGTQNSALAFGGNAPPKTTATEEWTGAGSPLTQTISTD